MYRTKFRTLVVALLAVVAAGVLAGPAQARWPQDGWSWITPYSSAYARTCPNTGCRAIATLSPGYPVGMLCYTDAQWATGMYTTNRWFLVYFQGNSFYNQGYVHASMVIRQTWTPHC